MAMQGMLNVVIGDPVTHRVSTASKKEHIKIWLNGAIMSKEKDTQEIKNFHSMAMFGTIFPSNAQLNNPDWRLLMGQVNSGHRMQIAVIRKAAKFLEMGAELAEDWVNVNGNILSFSSQHLLTHCRMCTRSGHEQQSEQQQQSYGHR